MITPILPGPIRQIGYIVRDLDRAIDAWIALGVGPWFTMRKQRQVGCVYRGAPSEPVLSMAFANSSELQVELIQQEDDTPSIYREFLDAGREGFHQLAWWADDFDAVMEGAKRAGWPVVYSGNPGTRFAYLEVSGGMCTIVEVMELNDATRWLADTVREASKTWDASQPAIRTLA